MEVRAGDSFEQWHATIKGPQAACVNILLGDFSSCGDCSVRSMRKDSPYEGGHFKLDIACTANYPYAAPQANVACPCALSDTLANELNSCFLQGSATLRKDDLGAGTVV